MLIDHWQESDPSQLDAAILQFLGLFDDWKPPVAALSRPTTQPESSREVREVRCHPKTMASGSAVHGTATIDMEWAAFALAASHHHHTTWLIVKGMCDYADSIGSLDTPLSVSLTIAKR